MSCLLLFLAFFKIGLLTIGGGLAALPLLYEEVVTGGWVSEREFVDMLAISQSTPGPIGINMATFAGFKVAGVPGALSATAGMVAPSLVILVWIARHLPGFQERPAVQRVLAALRPTAVGLIAAAAWFVLAAALWSAGRGTSIFAGLDLRAGLLFALLALVCKLRPHPPALTILAGALLGFLL